MIKLTTTGTLTVRPSNAILYRETVFFGKMSPYILCILGGFTSKSKPALNCHKNPVWTEIFTYNRSEEKEITFQVCNQNTLRKDDLIGECSLGLDEVFLKGKFEGILDLKYKGENAGKLSVKIEWRQTNNVPLMNQMGNMSVRPMMNNQPMNFNQPPVSYYNQQSYNNKPPSNGGAQLFSAYQNQQPPQFSNNNQSNNYNNQPPNIPNNEYNNNGNKSLNPLLFGAQNINKNDFNSNNNAYVPPINDMKFQENQGGFEYPKLNEVMTDIEYQKKMSEEANKVKN